MKRVGKLNFKKTKEKRVYSSSFNKEVLVVFKISCDTIKSNTNNDNLQFVWMEIINGRN